MAQNSTVANHHSDTKAPKSWTLLVVGEFGNMASFRLSKTLVWFLAVGFSMILAFITFGAVSYYAMHSTHKTLTNDLDDVKAALVLANRAKEEAQVRLMLLQRKAKLNKKAKEQKKHGRHASAGTDAKATRSEKLDKRKNGHSPDKKPPIVVSERAQPPASASIDAGHMPASTEVKPDKDPSDEPTESGETDMPVSPGSISVNEPQIWPTDGGTSIRFKFSLRNIDPEGRKITGYTFVVLDPEQGSKEPSRVSPWSPLEDGRPTILKRGQYFGISRFKYVRGRFPEIRDVQRFKTATVYVYSESGSLLLKEVYEVDEILRS